DRARRIGEHFQRRELRIDADAGRGAVALLELICRIDVDVNLDGLLRRTGETQRLRARAVAARGPRLDRARQRVGIVLEHDHRRHRVGRADADDGTFQDTRRIGEGGHGLERSLPWSAPANAMSSIVSPSTSERKLSGLAPTTKSKFARISSGLACRSRSTS